MSTKTAPNPAAPAQVKVPTDVPETDAQVEAKLDTATPAKGKGKTGNSAYADETVLFNLRKLLMRLTEEKGLTRPFVRAHVQNDDGTPFTDSQVWRAYNLKAYPTEVDKLLPFLRDVATGEIQVPGRNRKLRVEDVQAQVSGIQARVREAVEVLGNEAKTPAQYRKLVDAALEVLADVLPKPEPQPEADAKPEGDAPAEVKTEAEAPASA